MISDAPVEMSRQRGGPTSQGETGAASDLWRERTRSPHTSSDLMTSKDMELARGDDFYRHVLVLALVAALGILLFAIVRPFMSSLVWALLLAFLLSPSNRWARRLFKGSKGWAALAVTLAVLFCLALPTALLAGRFVVQGIDLVQRVSAAQARGDLGDLAWITRVGEWLEAHLPVEANQVYG
jgi:predicted PurR-regulated permease PerM